MTKRLGVNGYVNSLRPLNRVYRAKKTFYTTLVFAHWTKNLK